MTTVFILMPKEPRDPQRSRRARYSDVSFVYAETEHEAREQAARAFSVAGEESRNPWLDPATCVCCEAAMIGDRPPAGYRGVHFMGSRISPSDPEK
jgi:hypothetical protein